VGLVVRVLAGLSSSRVKANKAYFWGQGKQSKKKKGKKKKKKEKEGAKTREPPRDVNVLLGAKP